MKEIKELSEVLHLTNSQRKVLTKMRDEQVDIVVEKGSAFVGDDRTNVKLVRGLLRHMAIRQDEFSSTVERYEINETGLELLKKH